METVCELGIHTCVNAMCVLRLCELSEVSGHERSARARAREGDLMHVSVFGSVVWVRV